MWSGRSTVISAVKIGLCAGKRHCDILYGGLLLACIAQIHSIPIMFISAHTPTSSKLASTLCSPTGTRQSYGMSCSSKLFLLKENIQLGLCSKQYNSISRMEGEKKV